MTDPRPIKVAVLSFAHTHAMSYTRLLAARGDVDLLTADPDGRSAGDDAPRGAELARLLDVPYLDSYDAALDWGPDAVVITAENARHRELAERAAMAGAHILCEKPLATTVADAAAVRDAAHEAGVHLMVAYPVHFSPAVADLRARVRSGRLGRILGVRGTNNGQLPDTERSWFTDPHLAGGGALVDHVVHCAELLDDLLGETADTVRAVSNRILYADASPEVETGGLVTVRYPSGIIATIDCSWSYPRTAPVWGGLTLQVTGTHGTAEIAPFAQHVAGYDATGPVFESVGDDLDALMLDAFMDAVRGERAPVPDGDVGYRTVQVMDAARRSAPTGRPVTIHDATAETRSEG